MAMVPQARLVRVPGAAHALHVDRPSAFVGTVLTMAPPVERG
jgi:pimeloyl-ACP methyl ester carboxylesterase